MKNTLLYTSISVLFFSSGINAQDVRKILTAHEIVWCGIDFTLMKCIGSEGFTNPAAIAAEYPGKWNDLVIVEPKKFDVSKACGGKSVIFETDVVQQRNQSVDSNGLVTEENYKISHVELEKTISEYPDIDRGDIGFTLVVESLNKNQERGFMYAVYFDTSTKEIIWSKYYDGQTGGFGFRNHWATTFSEVLKQCAKSFKKLEKGEY